MLNVHMIHVVGVVQGRCDDEPPDSFGLEEPMPPGACAILVKEDFIDAPLGTTCLLLDSLYVAIAEPGSRKSAVLVLHVRGCPLCAFT